MTEQQQAHIDSITAKFANLATRKYEAGTIEHPGNLWDLDVLTLLYELRNECIDSFVYLQSVIDVFEKIPETKEDRLDGGQKIAAERDAQYAKEL